MTTFGDRSLEGALDLPELQAAALEYMDEAVYVRGADRQLLYVNPAAERLTGRKLDVALSMPCYRVFGDAGGQCNRNCPIDRAIAAGEPLRHLEGSVVDTDGNAQAVEVTVAPVPDPNSPAKAIVILRDISKLRALEKSHMKALMAAEQANRAAEESEARFRDFAGLSSDWLWETDTEHRFSHVSGNTVDDAWRFLGRRRQDMVDTESDPDLWQPFFKALDAHEPIEDFVYPMKGRSRRRAWISISAKPLFDHDGAFQGYRGIGHEVTGEVEENERLRSHAMLDHLTKLLNRRAFDEMLVGWTGPDVEKFRGFGLVFIDLDGFKAINDARGHDAGDQVLSIVAERLRACLRREDQVARLGGDEFAALLSNTSSEEQAGVVAQKIVDRVGEPMVLDDGKPAAVGASVGLAMFPTHGTQASSLVQAADHAMYHAKRAGKGQYRIAAIDPVLVGEPV